MRTRHIARSVRIDATLLTNMTTLNWLRGPEADLAGYEVLWRETTSSDWTHVIPRWRCRHIHDRPVEGHVFFGVRAVDADGNHSPVAFAQP